MATIASRVFSFDLLPDRSQCFPAFINLQQYYVEEWLVDLVEETPHAELRWQSRVTAVRDADDHVEIAVETPEGSYSADRGLPDRRRRLS